MTDSTDTNEIQEPIINYDKPLNYSDYVKFDFDYMVELIRGRIFKMTPAPSSRHQDISVELTAVIYNYLKGKSCRLFHAPFDVILPIADQNRDTSTTVVQPDLCIICDLSKIDKAGCTGPPDLIIEILSPSTSKKDLTHKYEIYEQTGVKEYWVIYPRERILQVYLLENDNYQRPLIYSQEDSVSPVLFPDLDIDLTTILREEE